MPKANRKCSYCDKEYYVCFSCVDIHSWKHIACSPECYRKIMAQDKPVKAKVLKQSDKEEIKVLLTVKTKSNERKNIIGYDFELGRFDCEDKTTLLFKDIKEFVVPCDEMKKLSQMLVECRKNNQE